MASNPKDKKTKDTGASHPPILQRFKSSNEASQKQDSKKQVDIYNEEQDLSEAVLDIFKKPKK